MRSCRSEAEASRLSRVSPRSRSRVRVSPSPSSERSSVPRRPSFGATSRRRSARTTFGYRSRLLPLRCASACRRSSSRGSSSRPGCAGPGWRHRPPTGQPSRSFAADFLRSTPIRHSHPVRRRAACACPSFRARPAPRLCGSACRPTRASEAVARPSRVRTRSSSTSSPESIELAERGARPDEMSRALRPDRRILSPVCVRCVGGVARSSNVTRSSPRPSEARRKLEDMRPEPRFGPSPRNGPSPYRP